MTATTVTRWWWLRHAPIVGTAAEIVGQADPAADCRNGNQIRALEAKLPADAVWIASPLRRCRQTAAALTDNQALIEPDLAEQHFGDWQGLSWDDLSDDPAARRFWRAPATTPPPGGESFADVVARVAHAIDRLTGTHVGRDIVVVAHAGTIRAALAHALDLDPVGALGFVVDPLSLTRLDRVDKSWRIGGVNLRHDVTTVT